LWRTACQDISLSVEMPQNGTRNCRSLYVEIYDLCTYVIGRRTDAFINYLNVFVSICSRHSRGRAVMVIFPLMYSQCKRITYYNQIEPIARFCLVIYFNRLKRRYDL
jgi:hypothetical protein